MHFAATNRNKRELLKHCVYIKCIFGILHFMLHSLWVVIVVSVGSHYKLNTTTCCSLYCAAAILQLCCQLPHIRCILTSLEGSFRSTPNINGHYRTYYGTTESFKHRRSPYNHNLYLWMSEIKLHPCTLYIYMIRSEISEIFFVEIWCLTIYTT